MNSLLVASCLLLVVQNAGRPTGPDQNTSAVPANEAAVAASISTIAENLRKADQGLSTGETGTETLAAQQKAIEELEKLIDAARSDSRSRNASSPSTAGSEQRAGSNDSPKEQASSTQQDPQGGSASQRPDKASSSDENATAPAGSANVLQRFRANVVRDAWGHLPQRLRDQLLNVSSDKYLPKYDGLVRDYFESLATPGSESPRPARAANGP